MLHTIFFLCVKRILIQKWGNFRNICDKVNIHKQDMGKGSRIKFRMISWYLKVVLYPYFTSSMCICEELIHFCHSFFHNSFSTFDRDVDGWSGDCSSYYTGAWWYADCGYTNLNGQFFHQSKLLRSYYFQHVGMTWYDVDAYLPLKQSTMKVRPHSRWVLSLEGNVLPKEDIAIAIASWCFWGEESLCQKNCSSCFRSNLQVTLLLTIHISPSLIQLEILVMLNRITPEKWINGLMWIQQFDWAREHVRLRRWTWHNWSI